MWVAPGNLALGEVEMNLVWKQPVNAPSAGKMHCTSTMIASTAPVMTANSCCKKLPAMGTPWRMRISLPVQHMPTTLMPVAPLLLGQRQHIGVLRGSDDHLREGRLVAVGDDVDLVLLEHAQVGHLSGSEWACQRARRRVRWRSSSHPSRRR